MSASIGMADGATWFNAAVKAHLDPILFGTVSAVESLLGGLRARMDIFAPHFTYAMAAQRAYLPAMVQERRPRIKEEDLHGFKHFNLLLPVLESVHADAC